MSTIFFSYSSTCLAVSCSAFFADRRYCKWVSELFPGGTFQASQRFSQRFANGVAKFYAAEVVSAFEYLHSKDIIYRDLKPVGGDMFMMKFMYLSQTSHHNYIRKTY